MPRLPQPGADAGNWGQILNDYLSVEHNGDGSLKDVARSADLASKANQSDLAAKYTKPGSGIPKADLEQPIQDTLDTIPTKANQSDLTATNTRIDAVHKADGTLKDQVITSAALANQSVTRGALAEDVAAALVTPAGLRWGFLGDSITKAATIVNFEWAYMMQAISMAGGTVARRDSVEAGISGQRADQMLARIDTLLDAGIQGLVVLAGTNDATQGRTLEQYAADMTAIIRRAKGRGIPVVVCTPPPQVAAVSAATHKLIYSYALWINLIAPTLGAEVADVYSSLVGADGYLPASLAIDNVHPTQRGHWVLAQPVARAMMRAANKQSVLAMSPSPLNAVPDPLQARATPTTAPWFQQSGGTGTAPTYSMVSDTTGTLRSGRWAEMDFDAVSGGIRTLVAPLGAVTPGDLWLFAAQVQVEQIAGDWVAMVQGNTAHAALMFANQSGVVIGLSPYYRSAGLPISATVFALNPVWVGTIPAGTTSLNAWYQVKLPDGAHVKARFGACLAINLTANGMAGLFGWGVDPVRLT